MKALLLFAIGLLSLAQPTFSQSAPQSLWPSLTISDGQCAEVIPADTLRRIGRHAYSTVTGRAYRFSSQGQEKENEINGAKRASYAFKNRKHDARIGRFLSIDPLALKYPYYSPYSFSGNRVIDRVELEGLEPATPPSMWVHHQEDRTGYYGDPSGTVMQVSDANSVQKYWVYQVSNQNGSTSWMWFDPNMGTEGTWRKNWMPESYVASGEDGAPVIGTNSTGNWWNEFRSNVGVYQPWFTGVTIYGQVSSNFAVCGLGGIAAAGPTAIALPTIEGTTGAFTFTELGIIGQAEGVLQSSAMNTLRSAFQNGVSAEVNIGGRTILYEPGWTYSNAMTLSGEGGFMLGPGAFASEGELCRSVLQELYRLTTSVGLRQGLSAPAAASETGAAAGFAEAAAKFLGF
jgi:hypothetical protein